jgi:hypothetical protein
VGRKTLTIITGQATGNSHHSNNVHSECQGHETALLKSQTIAMIVNQSIEKDNKTIIKSQI